MTEPKSTQNENTADVFIRKCLEEAVAASARVRGKLPIRRVYETPREREAAYAPYLMHLHTELWYSCMAHMMVRAQEADPTLAERLAIESQHWLDDGGLLTEFVWQWAAERGIDARTIFAKEEIDYNDGLDKPIPAPAWVSA